MASKKINPAQMAQLAAIKAGKQRPAETTPPTTPPIDWESELFGTTTTTTTTVPGTTTTTVPSGQIPAPKGQKSTDPLSTTLNNRISSLEAQLFAKTTPEERVEIKTGKKKPGRGFWGTIGSAVTGAAMLPIKQATIPLKTLSWIGRMGVSTFEESGQLFRDKVLGKKDVYERGDYIPIHKQTGKPIAKAGDPIVRNWEQIVNTPISDKYLKQIESATTQEAQDDLLDIATIDVIKKNARTSEGNLAEWARQVGSPTEFSDYGFGSIQEIKTGNKFVDYPVAFVGDVALDPTTYASFGTNIPAKVAIRVLGKEADNIIAKVLPEIAGRVGDDIARGTVSDLTKIVAVDVANATGDKATSKAVQIVSRAIVAEAAQANLDNIVAKGATVAQRSAAEKLVKSTANRYSAIAGARQVGAGARQALATTVQGLRDDALSTIADFSAPTVARRSAQRFVDTVTDDVIADIALRGNAALRGQVGQILTTPGGIRFKIGKRGFTLPGSAKVTAPLGGALSGTRRGLSATPYGKKVVDLTTRIGEGGLFGSEYIFNWRTGLRTGIDPATGKKLTTQQVVDTLGRLAEDQQYRAFKKAASQTIKIGVDGVFRNRAVRPFFNTVHSLLEDKTINWANTAQSIAATTGRSIDEVNFAFLIRDLQTEFEKILNEMSESLGGITAGYKFPDNWFPQAMNDKTIQWLSKATPEAKAALKALGLDSAPMPGQSIANSLYPGARWFGHTLSDADIEAGISRLNYLANNPASGAPFKGQFFDTNAASAVEKFARKFADDYAFLRRFAKEEFERAPLGWATGPRKWTPSIASPSALAELTDADTIDIAWEIATNPVNSAPAAMRLGVDNATVDAIRNEFYAFASMTGPSGNLSSNFIKDNADVLKNIIDENVTKYKLEQWSEEQINEAFAAVGRARTEAERSLNARNQSRVEAIVRAADELDIILSSMKNVISSNPAIARGSSDVFDAINDLSRDLYLEYQGLFAQNANKVNELLDDMSPNALRTVVNLTEDAYVKLDNIIIPDAAARADVAKYYANVRRLKDPKYANFASRWLRNYNRFIKTWVTATPGFHSRNMLSNAFMMIAAGGDIRFMNEGMGILNDWNKFTKAKVGGVRYQQEIVDELLSIPGGSFTSRVDINNPKVKKLAKRLNTTPDDIVNRRFIMDEWIYRRSTPRDDWRTLANVADIYPRDFDVEFLIDEFLSNTTAGGKYNPSVQSAFRETMMSTGAAGFGDVEEVFGAAIPSRLGITGQEVPLREGPIGSVVSKASEIGGAIPRVSRGIGGKIENYSRFMLTYSGIREGMSPAQAAETTARFLIDYEDLTKLDEVAKQVFPFWMWMSRNLPVQIVNMAMNPKAYGIYYNFRKNFEDKEGDNSLVPSYLKDAGLFKAPFGRDIYVKPDLGFPGVGSPSPLQEGVTDPRSLLSAIPAASLISALSGRQLFSGSELEGAGEIIPEVTRQALPPLGVLGRYASGLGAAGSDLPGPEWLQKTLGIKGPRESGKAAQVGRDFSSLFGLPGTLVGPDQENAARYEQIRRLQAYLDYLEGQR